MAKYDGMTESRAKQPMGDGVSPANTNRNPSGPGMRKAGTKPPFTKGGRTKGIGASGHPMSGGSSTGNVSSATSNRLPAKGPGKRTSNRGAASY